MSKEFICKGCGEKFNKDMQSNNVDYCYICNEFYMRKQIADLEAKLAVAKKTIEVQRKTNDALMDENLDFRNDITDVAIEQAKRMAEDWEFGYKEEIKELKQQLAEKEKELEDYKNSIVVLLSARQNTKPNATLRAFRELQNSIAVEQLQKVKEWCQGNAIQCFYNEAETEIKEKHIIVDRPQENGSPSLIKYIDNQIKQLKEGK